jgi:hypothetical protein
VRFIIGQVLVVDGGINPLQWLPILFELSPIKLSGDIGNPENKIFALPFYLCYTLNGFYINLLPDPEHSGSSFYHARLAIPIRFIPAKPVI